MLISVMLIKKTCRLCKMYNFFRQSRPEIADFNQKGPKGDFQTPQIQSYDLWNASNIPRVTATMAWTIKIILSYDLFSSLYTNSATSTGLKQLIWARVAQSWQKN